MLKCFFDERTDLSPGSNGLLMVSNSQEAQEIKKRLVEIVKAHDLSLHAKNDFKHKLRKSGAGKFYACCIEVVLKDNSIRFLRSARTSDLAALQWAFLQVRKHYPDEKFVQFNHDPHSWSKVAKDFINGTLVPNGWEIQSQAKQTQEVWLGVVDYLLYKQKK